MNSATAVSGEAKPLTNSFDRRGIEVVALSAAIMGVGASLGFVPGFLATALRDDLGISRGQVGLIVSLYFGCTGLGSILGGRLTDRFGVRTVVVADLLVVAGAAAMVSVVGEYWAWLVAAVLAGSGYALANAGTNVAITRSTPASRRTVAMSLKTSGVPLMGTLAAAVGPWAADRWSWQVIIWVIVGLGLTVAVTAAIVLDSDKHLAVRQTGSSSTPTGMAWFVLAAFLLIAGSQPLYSWTVAYLEQALDASPGKAGAVTALGSVVGACLMIVNGVRADRVGADQRIRRIIVLTAINAAATGLVLAGLALGIWVVLVGAVVGMSAQLAIIGTMHAAVIDRAPNAVARATGLTMTGYYLGALVSPAAFGALVDLTGTFAWSWLTIIVLLVASIPVWNIAGRVPIPSQGNENDTTRPQPV